MKVASWNIRGFHKPLKHGRVQHLLQQKDIQVMALMETKLNEDSLSPILQRRFSGMGHTHNFHLSNHGRILLIWDLHKVDMDIVMTTNQYIHCHIRCRISSRSFFVTFVYDLHSIVTRRSLWEALVDLGDNIANVWMVMGDFNLFLSIDEKKDGFPVTNHEMRDMQIFTQACGLVDLRSIGCLFTWSNGNVSCKLDRALVNSFWLMTDFDAYAEFTAPGCLLDHSCTIVHTLSKDRPLNRPFKFINMWPLHEDFEKVVKDSWAANIQGNAQYVLKAKMFHLKRCLRELNKNNFGHISEKAKREKEELEEVQRNILDGGPTPMEYTHIRKKANLLAKAERQFYQQMAKNVYLKSADKCTKSFHDVVKRNNKRNAIITLKKRNRDQTTSINEVAEEFVDYFHGLLGKKEAYTFLDSNEIAGRKLTLWQTESLIKPIMLEEIKTALHDIGSEKAPGPNGYGSKFFTSSLDIIGNDFIQLCRNFSNVANY
ncbi:uncharacterized protein LOC122054743 [Zingiber officinale]|uniref:uncharacterized protein LOC122054743 n=1 Tax=Zingiber officinale TaxID=94328 RepID=UPI001C4B84E1|nr:uncharacterized protein LOC122054743 [Zingiber officinale]